MSRLPTPGSDDNTWGDILNDYLAVAHNTDGSIKTGVITTTQIADGTITTTDISATAGIVKGQLSSAVQSSLGLADSALQSVPDATASSTGGVRLTGDLGGTASSPSLSTTGVSAGTYGSSLTIPVVTVDAKGRITSASTQTPAALQTYQISNTGNNDANKWTKIATQTVTIQYQDTQATVLLQAYNDGELIGSLVQLRMRTKQQSGFGGNPFVEAALVESTGSMTPANVIAVIVQNSPSSIVDFYIQVPEYNRAYQMTAQSIASAGSATTQLLAAQGYVATASLPAGVAQQVAKYDPINPASATQTGGIRLTGDIGGTAIAPTTPTAVHITGNESIAGVKTFTGTVSVPAPVNNTDAATKNYIDSAVSGTVSQSQLNSYAVDPSSIGTYIVGTNGITVTETSTQITIGYSGSGSGSSGGIGRTITQVSAAVTAAAAASTDYVYYWSGSSAYTLTMPTAASNTNRYTLKNASTVSQPVNTTSSQTIEGGISITISAGNSVDLISNGTNWMVI